MPKGKPHAPVFLAAPQFPPPPVTPPLGYVFRPEAPHPYLVERGLGHDALEHFDLGCSSTAAALKGRVPIPLQDAAGTLTGYACRWPADPVPPERSRYRFLGHGEDEPFNLHRVLQVGGDAPVVLTSAPFDVFHLWQCGYESVLGIFSAFLYERTLCRLLQHLPTRRFLLLFDETGRGRHVRTQVLEQLGRLAWVRALQFLTPDRRVESLTREEVRAEL